MTAGLDTPALAVPAAGPRRLPLPATKDSPRKPDGPKAPKSAARRTAARRARSKTRIAPSATAKPLLPVTERRSQEDAAAGPRPNKKTSDEKWEIAPDGSSAGREGRHFAVANVGNNGRIYLRPTVRPAHQRYPQPHFVFPVTPPSTAGPDARAPDKDKEKQGRPDATQLTPRPAPSTPAGQRRILFPDGRQLPRGHRRALSDSTIPDVSVARDSEPGGFKIVITHPGDEQRPRTVDDRVDPAKGKGTLLQVSIPSWKLGTPRFTLLGTPIIRGSSYAPTEEFPSSRYSLFNPSSLCRTPGAGSATSRRPSPIGIPQLHLPLLGVPSPPLPSAARLPPPNVLRSTYLSGHVVIEPAMFDALTFKPACDDRIIVRYSPASGAVTAATPPRLVAEITSPSFLDYELLSDFFLTFRVFLDPSDLLRMLIARLRWALARDDEIGMVVRVRTFVALRHWILNYFMDDFVPDYSLRVTFCNLLNDFVEELSQDPRGRKVQLKILAELKKCWRRVCAQYWDAPGFDATLDAAMPIAPGGIAGNLDSTFDRAFWERLADGPPRLDDVLRHSRNSLGGVMANSHHDPSKAGHIDSVLMGQPRTGTPDGQDEAPEDIDRQQASSPTSITSLDVVSCSFPTKNPKFVQIGSGHPLAPHPVDPSSAVSTEPVAVTPKALAGKRVRPQQTHKRNGSTADSLREHTTANDRPAYKKPELVLTLPYAGSLVRGNILPPGHAFVDVVSPNTPMASSRQSMVFQPHPTEARKDKGLASGMSGPGMRRLLGSVRRALSTRGQDISPTQGNFINISPLGPRGATANRLPGTAIVPQARPHASGTRPLVRIDLLGAEITEDFKKAVREDAAAYVEQRGLSQSIPSSPSTTGPAGEHRAHKTPSKDVIPEEEKVPETDDRRPFSDGGITTGSKSIVIFDDTVPLPMAFPVAMRGALPSANPYVEALTEGLMSHLAGPTPPNTPPTQSFGSPRRSSYVLSGYHSMRRSLSADQLPPFVPDLDTLGLASPGVPIPQPQPSQDTTWPSVELAPQYPERRPMSGRKSHMRRPSSRSYNSFGRRRAASFHSGIAPQPTIRSFDATTYTGTSVADDMFEVPMPQPLRVLRRRPGGNLRAATRVGQLDQATLRRSRSVGSLTVFTDSLRSSFLQSSAAAHEPAGFVDVVNSEYSGGRVEAFSLGAITEQKPKQPLSLFSTHSSKPIMRPSFQAEAQKLAQIPDDVDDDGGVESALLKLEGKYEKKQLRLSVEPIKAPLKIPPPPSVTTPVHKGEEVKEEKKKHRLEHVRGEAGAPPRASLVEKNAPVSSFLTVPRGRPGPSDEVQSFLSDESSSASYSSIPLLQRGLTDDGRRSKAGWTDHSILQGPSDGGSSEGTSQRSPSYDFIEKTKSLENISLGHAVPVVPRGDENESFLDISSEDEGELSSELSEDEASHDYCRGGKHYTSRPARSGTVGSRLPAHPLSSPEPAASAEQGRPSSPRMTLVQALAMSPETAHIPQVHDHQLWDDKPLPPTPETTPTTAQYASSISAPGDSHGAEDVLRSLSKAAAQDRKFSVHLPFILAFESDVLAQQFTLIEKDALNEIDWKELIEMRWKNAENIDSRSWVDFLRNTDARGVEVVIARFNIMVKWAISEVVLTQDLEERARCLIKLIHIAAHCRRYRNFATMSQIAIALSSNEITRLSKTWSLLPPADMRTLAELEALVSPTRNFYNLRAEMEGGGIASADIGCIPFVGIYTHDLIFNAQRPSEIASSPNTAPLVNFERCRIAAGVVKTLLRLLEASTLYTFQPVEGITERCLWMSALKDEDIRWRSEALE